MAYLPVSDIVVSLEPFNPQELVDAASVNILMERDDRDMVRQQLDGARSAAESQLEQKSKATSKAYTTQVDAHNQDMFITGFSKPIIVEQTPKQIESEASGDDILENSFSGELDSELLNESLHDEALNLLENDQVQDLAIDAAGMYLSSQTGGVVPPSVCSAVVEAGVDYMESGDFDTESIVQDAVLAEVGGEAFEGVTDQYIDVKVDNMIDSDVASENFMENPDEFLDDVAEHVEGFAGDIPPVDPVSGEQRDKLIGGVNVTNKEALKSGVAAKVTEKAAKAGDPSIFDKAVSKVQGDPKKFSGEVINLGSNMMQNPANLNTYTGLVSKAGVNFGEYLQSGTGFGCDAMKNVSKKAMVGSGLMTEESYGDMSDKLGKAVDSKKFKKITNMGQSIARSNMPAAEYKQMNAITDMSKLATTANVKNPSSANNAVMRSAANVFNNGKSFNSYTNNVPGFEQRSTLTKYAKNARDIAF